MTANTLRLFTAIVTALAVSLLSTAPASAVPKLTPGSKRYCSCTCATQDRILFYPLWEKRYACNLADNNKCTHKEGGSTTTTGTLHSCTECEKTSTGGLFCVNTALGPRPLQAPPGKLEQVVPRGIEGTQEIEPPSLESQEKEK